MQLTPEQRAELERARQDGRRRVHLTLTEEQRKEQERAIAEEEQSREENIAAYQRRRAAAAEPGLAGDLRRAINAARRPSDQLASEIGVDTALLEQFREGSVTLPLEAVDRLISTLALRLMAEIRG